MCATQKATEWPLVFVCVHERPENQFCFLVPSFLSVDSDGVGHSAVNPKHNGRRWLPSLSSAMCLTAPEVDMRVCELVLLSVYAVLPLWQY